VDHPRGPVSEGWEACPGYTEWDDNYSVHKKMSQQEGRQLFSLQSKSSLCCARRKSTLCGKGVSTYHTQRCSQRRKLSKTFYRHSAPAPPPFPTNQKPLLPTASTDPPSHFISIGHLYTTSQHIWISSGALLHLIPTFTQKTCLSVKHSTSRL
jgi:hypothetical protein